MHLLYICVQQTCPLCLLLCEIARCARSCLTDSRLPSHRILERLPVIVEEYADWQRDFWDLQTQQARYGIKFPAEMGFKYDEENPLTMEEIMERSPVTLAPRR